MTSDEDNNHEERTPGDREMIYRAFFSVQLAVFLLMFAMYMGAMGTEKEIVMLLMMLAIGSITFLS